MDANLRHCTAHRVARRVRGWPPVIVAVLVASIVIVPSWNAGLIQAASSSQSSAVLRASNAAGGDTVARSRVLDDVTATTVPTSTFVPTSTTGPTTVPTSTSVPTSTAAPTTVPTSTSVPTSTPVPSSTSTHTVVPTSTDTAIPTSSDTATQTFTATSTNTAIATATSTVGGLTLSPSSGASGASVYIYGSGFSSSEEVSIYVAGTYDTYVYASSGAVSTYISFPSTTITGYVVVELLGASSGHEDTGEFDVTSTSSTTLTLSPTSGSAGTTVTAYGSGFTAGETVEVMANGSEVETTATSSSSVTVSFTFPSTSSTGYKTVELYGLTSGHVATASFYVSSTSSTTLTLSPTYGTTGSTVTAYGTGFTYGELVELMANGSYVTEQTATSTAVTISFSYPSTSSTGYQTVEMYGLSSGHTATASFDVTSTSSSTLTLSPTSGSAGTTVTAYGTGFTYGESIELMANGTEVEEVTASSTAVTVSFSYPSTSSTGYQTVELYGLSSGHTASGSFYVSSTSSSTLTLSPTSGTTGTTVTAYGTGFTYGESVEVLANGTEIEVVTATSTAVTISFSYPSTSATGYQTVELYGLSSGHTASASFYVTATSTSSFTLSPTSGKPGATVSATGYETTFSLYGAQTVTISFGGTQVATVTPGTAGYFSVSFTVPSGFSGTVTVTATAAAYGYSASQTFSVVKPTLTLGSSSAVPGTLVSLSGTGYTPGETVTITLPGGGTTTATAGSSGALSTSVTIPAGLSAGSATISAIGSSSQITVSATLTITGASLSARPASVSAGSQVTFSGSGFAPGEVVQLSDSTGDSQSVVADNQGGMSVTITVPATQVTGSAAFTARGLTSKSSASATVFVAAVAVRAATPTSTPRPTVQVSPTVAAPSANTGSSTWYFAAGRTDKGYSEQVDVLNPNHSLVRGTITLYYGSGKSTSTSFSLGALERGTYDVGSIVGMQRGIAIVIKAGMPVAATVTGEHGTTNKTVLSGVSATADKWYFADGYTTKAFVETLDVFNPGSTSASVRVTWPRTGGKSVQTTFTVAAHSVRSVSVNKYVPGTSHAMIVSSNHAVVVARETVFGSKSQGTMVTQGTSRAATKLYLAEGSTTGGVQESVTVLDPGSKSAHVTLTFYASSGKSIAKRTLTVGSVQRQSIDVNSITNSASVAAVVSSDVPVVAERIIFTGSPNGSSAGGTDVLASAIAASGWAFASGDTSAGNKEFITLLNPVGKAATIVATWYSSSGELVQRQFTLPANARITIDVSRSAGTLPAGSHATVLRSLAGSPFVVEQSLYDGAMKQCGTTSGTSLVGS